MDSAEPLVGKLGVSRSLLTPSAAWVWPLHGLCHPPEADTSGWYWWTGELTDDKDFFVPLHACHLVGRWSEIAGYLGLEPGSRVLLAPGHSETYDATLLDV